jgi:UV excision repair protein RAD23
MKVIIKNLKQVTFEIEVPSAQSTVLDLKKAIEKERNFDSEQLKLLFLGVILDNTKKLADYKIEEGATIILMMSKVKVKNNPQQQPDQKVNPQSNEEKKEEKQEQKQEEKQEQKQEEKKPEQKPQESDENKYAAQIASLIDMGFEKSQAEAAIKAAHGQIDLAVDYLYNGIPEGTNDNLPFMEGEGEEGGEEGGDEDPLKKTASIAKILCQNDPSKLTNLMQNIQQNDPDLFALINEREEEFKNLLEQPVNEEDIRNYRSFQHEMGLGGGELGGHGHGQGHGTLNLNLTPEDRVVINRLKDLGNFNEADVIQDYIACDKNEEMAANYLFEQKMNDDNNNNGN